MICRNAYLRNVNDANECAACSFDRRTKADNRSRLYLLSFLLTADSAKAKQCCVSGLDLSAESPLAFREWTRSWAEKIVIGNAVRLIAPRPNVAAESVKTRQVA